MKSPSFANFLIFFIPCSIILAYERSQIVKKVLTLITLITLFLSLMAVPVNAVLDGGFTEEDITNELHRIMRIEGYGSGNHWEGRDGYPSSEGCYGFARDVFNRLFGITIRFSYDDGYTTSPHLYCVVSTTESKEMKDLLSQAQPGDIFCFGGKANNPHSMIVYANDPEGETIDIYDNNWAGPNIVELRKGIPYSFYINHLADGRSSRMSIFRYTSEAPIELQETEKLMMVGEKTQLSIINPPESFNAPVWVSSNPSVATINDHGLVTALHFGKTTIICYAGKLTSTCEIEVMDIQLNRSEIISPPSTFFRTYRVQMEVIIYRADFWPSFSGEIRWETSNPSVARIDSNGLITIREPGDAIISAFFMYNGSPKVRTCVVRVR